MMCGSGEFKDWLTSQVRIIQVEVHGPSTVKKQDEGAWDDAEGKMAVES